MRASASVEQHEWIEQLARLADRRAVAAFFRRNGDLRRPETVSQLYDEIIKRARADLKQADRLAAVTRWLAEQLDDDYCRALSLRASGHILYLRAKHTAALEHYQSALALFERLGREHEVGRTLNSSLHVLIYLGRYDQAFQWGQRARQIFERHGDRLRLARLDINMGNILYRQDRFEEALESYHNAQAGLAPLDEAEKSQDVAVVLRNMAVCYISLNQFARALETYREARAYCEQHGMPLLVAETDYNIAYLYYLRGEYMRAIELYQAARAHCEKLGDPYHQALCDLDQSEMYLELNLAEEGAELAQHALTSFSKLGMRYEQAKAVANLAIAASHQGKVRRALDFFGQAKELFTREQNHIWPALIDLYQAMVLQREGRRAEARRLCESALAFFSQTSLAGKAALSALLLARLQLEGGEHQAALETCRMALDRLERAEIPALSYQGWFLLGQIEEALGDRELAYEAYQQAHSRLENLRSHLQGEEIKIAFLKDKLAVYENLVWMCLARRAGAEPQREAFTYIEQAKSRGLADLIAFRAQSLPARADADSRLIGQVHDLREELNWCYHQIDLEEMQGRQRSTRRVENLRRRARICETQLLKTVAQLRTTDQEFAVMQHGGSVALDLIRSMIPADALFVEYYQARDMLFACLVNRKRLEIVPLAEVSQVRSLLRLLQFQLSKFRLGPDHVRTFSEALRAATEDHLHDLYDALVRPIRRRLDARHLIVVPHDFLHYLPFHALFDGKRFLADEFSISYAPSASVYYLCCAKPGKWEDQSLILGVPDALTPHIVDEVHGVAATLPNPQLYLGEDATEERLNQDGPASRFVHIATHGLFRQDNPMFSSIRLGKSQLSLFDLYHLRLSSELVTLSGCGTGLNVVVGGDELLGLVRGLLYAGAQAVLVTLWDVNDRSTAEFMKVFYQQLRAGQDKAAAAQHAMREVRETNPHPYYWAPFVLIGKFTSP